MNPSNPFAVLRLPANATAAEIKSAGQFALAKLRLGDAGNVAAIRAVESAIEQLRDPVVRFRMGLEWPSLGPAAAAILATDEAFSDLATDPKKDRTGAIEQLIVGESVACQQHTWAIFFLSRAHGLFACALRKDSSVRNGAQSNDLAAASDLFPKAMGLWIAATTSPEFWMAQRLRATEINDARVSAELCSACQRESLQIAAQSFATLASEALLAHTASVCTAIISGIKGCGGVQSDIDQVLSEAYRPICSRATSALDALQARVAATKSNSGAAFRKILTEYVRDIHADIRTILTVGDLPGTAEERCRDAAASFLRELAVESANQADAYGVSTKCLRLAQEVVDSTQIRGLIAADCLTLQKIAGSTKETDKVDPLRIALHAAIESKRLRNHEGVISADTAVEMLLDSLKLAIESNQFRRAIEIIANLIRLDPSNASELRFLKLQVLIQLQSAVPEPSRRL